MKKIDFRSDTVTMPSEEMMEAINSAELGDDVYGEDPTVNELEEKAAKMLGKEAGLLVCSGTMGNLCGTITQTNHGDEIVLVENAHIFLYEVAGAAVIGGLQLKTVRGIDNYLISPEILESAIRADNIHCPKTSLVCIENTHNVSGGKIWTKQQTDALIAKAKEYDLKVHIDGARIFNAAVALDLSVSELTKEADSITFCLSKGLACPIGSLIVGNHAFIEKARRTRKMLGGGMRQAGIIAAPGLVALDSMVDRLAEDHQNAQSLARGLAEIDGISIQDCPTNILYIDLSGLGISGAQLSKDLASFNIITRSWKGPIVRLVTHYGIEREDIDFTIEKFHSLYGKR
ncbi:MAG: low-specificity L-threonine aldolase [Candidatus Heimdallarchaeota archaeon]|nr:low-specificity L-threonine aldolase [Candidatus Heimdallarchaeota archaeon]